MPPWGVTPGHLTCPSDRLRLTGFLCVAVIELQSVLCGICELGLSNTARHARLRSGFARPGLFSFWKLVEDFLVHLSWVYHSADSAWPHFSRLCSTPSKNTGTCPSRKVTLRCMFNVALRHVVQCRVMRLPIAFCSDRGSRLQSHHPLASPLDRRGFFVARLKARGRRWMSHWSAPRHCQLPADPHEANWGVSPAGVDAVWPPPS
jgi:hypothetical protein